MRIISKFTLAISRRLGVQLIEMPLDVVPMESLQPPSGIGGLHNILSIDDQEDFLTICDEIAADLASNHPWNSTISQSVTKQTVSPLIVSFDGDGAFCTKTAVEEANPPVITPYESLKMLVSAKAKQTLTRTTRSARLSPNSEASRLYSKPSSFLRRVLHIHEENTDYKDWEVTRPTKKQKMSLHEACQFPNERQSTDFLSLADPKTALIRQQLSRMKTFYDIRSGQVVTKELPEDFSIPLNIAIQHKADSTILKLLIDMAPGALTIKDGSERKTSILILLQHKPDDFETLVAMLGKCPSTVFGKDAKFNNVLHVGCASGVPVKSINKLVNLNPMALFECNFHGLTPLQIAQRSLQCCPDDVVQNLWDALQNQF